jgi:hypothetical protein
LSGSIFCTPWHLSKFKVSKKKTLERAKEPTILGEQSDDVWIGEKQQE